MSAAHVSGATARAFAPTHWREASLRLVPTPGRRAPRAAFVTVVMLVLGTGLVGLLLMTTGMQQRAFALFEMQGQVADLREQRQTLTAELAEREAPGALAKAATLAGMVPNDTPAFLDLESATILGEIVPAPVPPGGGR
ncbi:MAG: hypothetical protein WCA82_01295 [Jiangellales bacterium]|jgi:hypothetical protein